MLHGYQSQTCGSQVKSPYMRTLTRIGKHFCGYTMGTFCKATLAILDQLRKDMDKIINQHEKSIDKIFEK